MKTRSRNSFPVRSRKIAGCARKIARESRRKLYGTDRCTRAEKGGRTERGEGRIGWNGIAATSVFTRGEVLE